MAKFCGTFPQRLAAKHDKFVRFEAENGREARKKMYNAYGSNYEAVWFDDGSFQQQIDKWQLTEIPFGRDRSGSTE